jgi:hypothetical protein
MVFSTTSIARSAGNTVAVGFVVSASGGPSNSVWLVTPSLPSPPAIRISPDGRSVAE